MNDFYFQMKDLHKDARRGLDRVTESFKDAAAYLNNCMEALDAVGDMIAEIERLQRELEDKQAEIENLQRLLQVEKDAKQTLEVRLSEMSKLSAGVAKKSPQEELLKALRTFVNKSKHKRIEKRTAVKEMVLELAVTNGITLPDDLMQTIDSLDDEQPESKVVNTYNAPVGQVIEHTDKIENKDKE